MHSSKKPTISISQKELKFILKIHFIVSKQPRYFFLSSWKPVYEVYTFSAEKLLELKKLILQISSNNLSIYFFKSNMHSVFFLREG